MDIKNVIEECNRLGYVTILAHPVWIRNFNEDGRELSMEDLFNAIIDLKSAGLDGIEIGHRLNNKDSQIKLLNLAREFDLLTTGDLIFMVNQDAYLVYMEQHMKNFTIKKPCR